MSSAVHWLGANAFSCSGADACSSEGVQRGIQETPDGRRILVNKDVGTERWAITLNSDGTALGNVFRSDGGPPSFLSCDPLPDANHFACYGADDCSTDRCVDQYAFIANIELPPSFFQPPTPCGSSYSFIANIVLPAGFFVPVRPTLEFFSLPSATIPSGSTAPFEVSADASTDSLVLQFNSGQSLIGPDILVFPSGEVFLDYVGHIDPQSLPPPYRVGFAPRPVSILPIPNSPVLPLELGTYQVLVANVAPTAATVNGTVIRTRRSNLNVGRLDLRIFFVGIAGLDASTAANNSAFQAILDEFNRKLGAAGIQLGTVTLQDYPQDRATALTVVDLERDGNGNGVADQMEEIFSLPRPMGQRTLDLFLVTDIIGASGLVIGFSGAIPGPALAPPSVQSGVVAAVLQSPGQPQDNAALAQTIVHETGHYLGLYHTTELVGGLGDPLVDTPFCTTIAVLALRAMP